MGLMALLVAPAAQGNLTITKWESLTCKENKDIPTALNAVPELGYESTLPAPGEQCTNATTRQILHPGRRSPELRDHRLPLATAPHPPAPKPAASRSASSKRSSSTRRKASASTRRPCRSARSAQLTLDHLPAGLAGRDQLPDGRRAERRTAKANACPAGECVQARVALPVYNLVPFDGVPSMVGFLTEGGPTFIVGSLDPVDQHVTFTIDVHPPSATSPPIIESRLVFNGVAGNGTYLTMPSNCAGGQTTLLHLLGLGGIPPFEPMPTNAEASFTTAVGASGCATVPFKPTIDVAPQGGRRRLAGSDDGQRRDPVRSQRTDRQLVPENRESRPARRDGPQPGLRQRPASPAPTRSSARARTIRSPVRPRRRSAPSRCRPRRCRPTR